MVMSPLEYHFIGFTRLICLARCLVAESCTVDFKVLRFAKCLKLQDFPQCEVTSGNLPAVSPKREVKLVVAKSLIELALLLRFLMPYLGNVRVRNLVSDIKGGT
jgi:hypothetical protein